MPEIITIRLSSGLAGRSKDQSKIYLDESIPLWMRNGIRVHEEAEARYISWGLSYEAARQKATAEERIYVEAKGLDWAEYDRAYKKLLREIEGRHPKPKEPADMFHGADGEKPLQKERARDYKQEYRDYHGKPAQIKERAQRNAARRKLGLRVGDSREVDHKNPLSNGGSNNSRNLRMVQRSTNREKGPKVKKVMAPSALDRLNLPVLKVKDDSGHEHDSRGKFTGTGGGSGAGKKPNKNKPTGFSPTKAPKDFVTQRDKLPKDLRAFLSIYSSEEYIKMGAKLHLSATKQSGFALKPGGELISVFSLPGAHEGHSAIEAAIRVGATKLDCLGEPLREIYEAHGFKVVEVYLWNEKYRPKDWDEKKHGKPNVYYMELRKDGT